MAFDSAEHPSAAVKVDQSGKRSGALGRVDPDRNVACRSGDSTVFGPADRLGVSAGERHRLELAAGLLGGFGPQRNHPGRGHLIEYQLALRIERHKVLRKFIRKFI